MKLCFRTSDVLVYLQMDYCVISKRIDKQHMCIYQDKVCHNILKSKYFLRNDIPQTRFRVKIPPNQRVHLSRPVTQPRIDKQHMRIYQDKACPNVLKSEYFLCKNIPQTRFRVKISINQRVHLRPVTQPCHTTMSHEHFKQMDVNTNPCP